jgi:glycosyltransferase involved in cell wall biosynthesis
VADVRSVSIVVATFGSLEWADRGDAARRHAIQGQTAESYIHVHLENGTLADARNLGAQDASGEWLCFLDADDELAPGYLDEMRRAWMLGAIFEDWAPLLVPSILYADDPLAVPTIPDWDRDLYALNCACIGTLVRRDLFLDAGGFGEEPIYEDWALWLRLVAAGAKMLPVRDAVYRYHQNAGSLRNQAREHAESTWRAVRAVHAGVPANVWAEAKIR